ncbi:hypothetical protein CEV33_2729 [Brucella grignonensis]|uniref:Uncharacterized protein n=1 Tax=Brucella grignonensis TaxID=94627 RepID=A0A256F2T9_9HYPH|nr:hypothetical protein CEV33_2729 [Brucella grignonensis]
MTGSALIIELAHRAFEKSIPILGPMPQTQLQAPATAFMKSAV